MKKLLKLALCSIFCFTMSISAFAADTQKAGMSSALAYIDKRPINVYEYNNGIWVRVSDLNNYGFDVNWKTGDRDAQIVKQKSIEGQQTKAVTKITDLTETERKFELSATDSVITIGNTKVEALKGDNDFFIPLEALQNYGSIQYIPEENKIEVTTWDAVITKQTDGEYIINGITLKESDSDINSILIEEMKLLNVESANVKINPEKNEFAELEAYIQKNIDKGFELDKYKLSVVKSGGSLKNYSTIRFDYIVDGYLSNAYYEVDILAGKATKISYGVIPDYTRKYDFSTIKISDEAIKLTTDKPQAYRQQVTRLIHLGDDKLYFVIETTLQPGGKSIIKQYEVIGVSK